MVTDERLSYRQGIRMDCDVRMDIMDALVLLRTITQFPPPLGYV